MRKPIPWHWEEVPASCGHSVSVGIDDRPDTEKKNARAREVAASHKCSSCVQAARTPEERAEIEEAQKVLGSFNREIGKALRK